MGDEQDGDTVASSTSGAANTVDVGFVIIGHVVIDYVTNTLDIQAAGGDIGGDDDIDLALLQAIDGAFS